MTNIPAQREPGLFSASAPLAEYPLIYNIEMDPHEDLVVGGVFAWTGGPLLEVVEKYVPVAEIALPLGLLKASAS